MKLSRILPQLSSALTICSEAASCAFRNGLSGEICCRLLRTCWAMPESIVANGCWWLQHLILQVQRLRHPYPFRESQHDRRLHEWLKERAVEREIELRNLGNRREHALVFGLMAAKRANVVQCAGLAPHDPFAGDEFTVRRAFGLLFELSFVEPGRQDVDEVDVAGKLAVLFLRNTA